VRARFAPERFSWVRTGPPPVPGRSSYVLVGCWKSFMASVHDHDSREANHVQYMTVPEIVRLSRSELTRPVCRRLQSSKILPENGIRAAGCANRKLGVVH
jgi:hypothetical protein